MEANDFFLLRLFLDHDCYFKFSVQKKNVNFIYSWQIWLFWGFFVSSRMFLTYFPGLFWFNKALQDYFGFIRYLSCLIYILSLWPACVFPHLICAILLQISIYPSPFMTIIYRFMFNYYKMLPIVLRCCKALTHLPWLCYLLCLCLGSRQVYINYILLSLRLFYGCNQHLLWPQTQWLAIWVILWPTVHESRS